MFDRLDKEAENLFIKLDQRRTSLVNNRNKQLVPKEIKNLIFDVNNKDEGARSELWKGRKNTKW